MIEEEMILEEQIEQETALEEVENYEEQTEQDATNSLDDILAGVNELLEQSASYNAYLEESESEPQSEIIAYDNGNAVEVSDLEAIAVQAANSSVFRVLGRGLFLIIFLPSCGKIPANIMLHFGIANTVISCIMGMV